MRLSTPIQVDVEKVDDIAEPKTIDEIANCAAEDQVKTDPQEAIRHCSPKRVRDHDEENADRANVEEQRNDRRLRIRADSKGCAGVAHVHELKKIRNQRN